MRKTRSFYIILGLILIAISVVLLMWFLLRGQTSVEGSYPDPEVSKSFVCSKDDFNYPIYLGSNAIKSNANIVAIFSGDSLDTISLTQRYYYEDNANAMANKSRFQVTMSKSFSASSLEYGALNVNYAVTDNLLRMSIVAKDDEINTNSKKYFLITDSPATFSEYRKNFENQNFICNIKDNN